VEGLPKRKRHVIVRRYGLDGSEPALLREIGEELGVSHTAVRKLQLQAERALRAELERSSTSADGASTGISKCAMNSVGPIRTGAGRITKTCR
jgi:DNA-directed RNA polymerase sigma subunit (sigma70/sigma32)